MESRQIQDMEILNYIGFIKTTVPGGGKWQLSPATEAVPSAVAIDEQNCVSADDSGICADLCFLKCGELLEFLSDKEEEWELLRSRLR